MSLELGATYLGDGRCRFSVWAPRARRVDVHLVAPEERVVPLTPGERGYHHATVEGVRPGARYLYRLDGERERPDPASRFQPDGVHAPSQVVDPRGFAWEDQGWFGLPLASLVVYELHVGTFSAESTFEAIVPHLDRLRDLGINAIELMPVAQFPGGRNWGYDGVYPFAVQSSYGGPDGLKRLVDAGHRRGLAVVLDVVYNHLGPEGNYLWDYGPYFTDRYRTPWGQAINFDGPHSDEVRRFFIENALDWLTEFHVDALRLDAIHAIRDFSARPFLEELSVAVRKRGERLNRRLHVIAESDLNDARVIRSQELGGYGLDAQWSDDFHHALHTLLTGEQSGYYQDFGRIEHLATALREGFVYSGQYSAYRQRQHGNSARLNAARQFVICAQNHDQVGNRMLGERLSRLVSFEALKLATAAVLLAPFIPLLFMGEEYGEPAPFLYFTSHSDPDLIEAVRRGRREEFAAFQWSGEPPDPQAEETFLRSKLHHELGGQGRHAVLLDFHRELIRLRKEVPPLTDLSKEHLAVVPHEPAQVLLVRRWAREGQALTVFSFGETAATVELSIPAGRWLKLLDSAEPRWLGDGGSVPGALETAGPIAVNLQPRQVVLFAQTGERLP